MCWMGVNAVLRAGRVSVLEVWKDIPGYEGRYQVSDIGRARSLTRMVRCADGMRMLTGRILKPIIDPAGYPYVSLGRKNPYRMHTLVLLAFVGKPHKGHVACHKNGNKRDNRPINLRWGTVQENNRDMVVQGIEPKRRLRISAGLRRAYAEGRRSRGRKLISYKGKTKTVSEWARTLGIQYGTLLARINSGWPIGRALGFVKCA